MCSLYRREEPQQNVFSVYSRGATTECVLCIGERSHNRMCSLYRREEPQQNVFSV
jgi:hypothetical protein